MTTGPGGAAAVPTNDGETAFWDDAYANGAYIEDGDAYPAKWASAAAGFRQAMTAVGRAELDRPYGPLPRERFDLFLPDRPAVGAVVYVHGGYWMAFDKSSWSHLAAGALAHGWAVAMPSYRLCPDERIAGIVAEVGRAVSAVAARVAGDLRLVGHSAGGHLVSRLCCRDSPLPDAVRARVRHTVSISGLHDLRPVLIGVERGGNISEHASHYKDQSPDAEQCVLEDFHRLF